MVWEERWHPLREEWVIVAAHRNNRPWTGDLHGAPAMAPPRYDPSCPLCPGNARVSGHRNPEYKGVFVFDNDLPCVGPDAPEPEPPPPPPYRSRPARGVARVVCYTPHHDLSLAELPTTNVAELLRTWQDQYRELGDRPEVEHVLMFENKGSAVGVSNPHPHCQIYATNFVFKTIANEVETCRRHLREHGRGPFEDVVAAELADGRRVLAQRDSALAFIPYFARFAYETFVAPRAPHASLADLSRKEVDDLAAVIHEVMIRFDTLWQMPFPYVMALHQAPTDGRPHDGFHFHIEFHPRWKPNLLKYLAGPELGGGSFLSDTCPEEKAAEPERCPPSTTNRHPPMPMRPMKPGDPRGVRRQDRGLPVPERPADHPARRGRLDAMGGIADYSGSMVLEMPIREVTYAAAQPKPTRRRPPRGQPPGFGEGDREYRLDRAGLDRLLDGRLRARSDRRSRPTPKRAGCLRRRRPGRDRPG
ncbi:MAG: galactose-1-phosphate uridylyltransferase [Isosphaeraceae bacterium]